MNRAVRELLIFTVGAAVGGLSTWFGVRKYYEIKADLEVEQVKEAYNNKIAQIDGIKTSLAGDIEGPEEIPSEKIEEIKAKNSIVQKLTNKPPLTDYTKYFEGRKSGEEESEELQNELAKMEHPEEEDREQTLEELDEQLNGAHRKAVEENIGPRLIDRSDFELTCDQYDKISLLYYISDDILCEDNNDEVNRYDVVGDLLESSGFVDNDDEEMFVRNDKLSTDFEVTKVYTPYDPN